MDHTVLPANNTTLYTVSDWKTESQATCLC